MFVIFDFSFFFCSIFRPKKALWCATRHTDFHIPLSPEYSHLEKQIECWCLGPWRGLKKHLGGNSEKINAIVLFHPRNPSFPRTCSWSTELGLTFVSKNAVIWRYRDSKPLNRSCWRWFVVSFCWCFVQGTVIWIICLSPTWLWNWEELIWLRYPKTHQMKANRCRFLNGCALDHAYTLGTKLGK